MAVETEHRDTLILVGGVAALLTGLAYVATIPLFAAVGAPPAGAEARLAFHAPATSSTWWAIVALSVATDVLYLPVAAALYALLHRTHPTTALLAALALALFVVLDLAVTWPSFAALIVLGGEYSQAAGTAQRSVDVAAATYPATVLGSTLEAVYSVGIPAAGILLAGLAMTHSAFGRTAGWLGVTTGVLGVVSVTGSVLVPGLGAGVIATSVLTTAWFLVVGVRLVRLGRR